MTYSATELVRQGVDARVIEWRQWRRKAKLTTLEVSLLTGMANNHIVKVETGRRRLGQRTLSTMRAFRVWWSESKRALLPVKVDGRGKWKRRP